MRKLFSILFFCLLVNALWAQFGLNGKYLSFDAADLELSFTDVNGESLSNLNLGTGYSFGIDYWFRLPDKRIEFLPELNVSFAEEQGTNLTFENNFYSFYFNTHIYLFDLASDCDCPTFSKQNDFLKKGFFLAVSPGISYVNSSLTLNEIQSEDTMVAFSIGGGIGIDIGVSDLFTVTPMAGIRYFPNASWELLNTELSSAITQFNVGLRLGFRLDSDY